MQELRLLSQKTRNPWFQPKPLLIILLLGILAGCQGSVSSLYREGLPSTANWAVLPFIDYTEAQGVSVQVERIMMVQLPAAGVLEPRLYPESVVTNASDTLAEAHRLQNGKQWATQHGIGFGLAGEILEWRYDDEGRAIVAVNLEVIDVRTDEQLWSVSGSSEGLPGQDLYDVCRTLFQDLLTSLPVNRQR